MDFGVDERPRRIKSPPARAGIYARTLDAEVLAQICGDGVEALAVGGLEVALELGLGAGRADDDTVIVLREELRTLGELLDLGDGGAASSVGGVVETFSIAVEMMLRSSTRKVSGCV